jgi:hypothetical protein
MRSEQKATMEPKPDSGLEIDTDDRQQEGEWRMQRVAWTFFTVLLILVSLGLFGRGGPLSDAEVYAADGTFYIEYERFMRNHSPAQLRVTFKAASDTARISVGESYLEHTEMDQITPQPERVIGEAGAHTYVFHTRPNARMQVVFQFMPDDIGLIEGWISLNDHSRQSFDQFVYP